MILDRLNGLPIRGIRKLGVDTLITLILLVVVMGSIAIGLEEVAYIQPDTSLVLIAILGLLYGWLFGRTSLSTHFAGFSLFAIGSIWVFIYSSKMSAKVFATIVETSRLMLTLIHWRPETPYPDTRVMNLLLAELTSISTFALHHLWLWSQSIVGGRPIYDLIGATLFWGLLVWYVSAWAGWEVRRNMQPLYAVLPGSTVLVFGLAYSRVDSNYLIPVLSGALLLSAWVRFTFEKQQWGNKQVDYAEDINFDMLTWTVAIVIAIVLLSFVLSFVSPQKIFIFVRDLGRSRTAEVSELGESLGLQQKQGEATVEIPQGELPRSHLLGSGPELSRRVVMIIEVETPGLAATQTISSTLEANYRWRALTYDIYTGRGWATSPTFNADYPAEVSYVSISSSSQIRVDQSVKVLADIQEHVYAAGELMSVNQGHQVSWRKAITEIESIPEPELTSPPDMFEATFEQSTSAYRANSLVNVVGTSELRASQETYPLWIRERYLQLPESVPERVIELAMQLTKTTENPYDKAQILENYLRQIPYNLDISPAPANQDVVDYFLFELEEGYCDYYASAMAVMGRAIGLPTRFVMGYATGLYDDAQDRFIITEKDAHSWVEVYFNDIGWVEFEPTGGLPGIIRPEHIILKQIPEDQDILAAPTAPEMTSRLSLLMWILGSIALLASLYLIWRLSDTWRLWQLPGELSTTSLYRRLFLYAKKMEIEQESGQTPNEFQTNLNETISLISTFSPWQRHWQAQIKAIREETHLLVGLYTRTIYSPSRPDQQSAHQAIRIWGILRRRLLLARLLRFLHRMKTGQKDLANEPTDR